VLNLLVLRQGHQLKIILEPLNSGGEKNEKWVGILSALLLQIRSVSLDHFDF
jgi:hypothetical protein